MDINFAELKPTQIYHLLVQSILPRPIAWIMTEQENGKMNIAPFSFFTPVCSNPPTFVVSIGNKSPEQPKDTYANLQRTGKCVVHIASTAQIDAVNQSAASLGEAESEVEENGLNVVPFVEGGLGRIKGAPVAFACKFQQVVGLGAAPQHIVFLEVEQMYIDDEATEQLEGRMKVSAQKIDPLAKLGGPEYAGLGEILARTRPA